MHSDRTTASADPARFSRSSDSGDHILRDCWLVEVMPPTWAWAYGQLLDLGRQYEDSPRRLA